MNNQEIYVMLKCRLNFYKIDNPEFEAKQIMGFVLNQPATTVTFHSLSNLTVKQQHEIENLCQRRCNGYPLQYLLGEWEFFGYPFFVGEGVLIPRQDTEILCETAINLIKTHQHPRILDLCSGSGCLAVSIKKQIPHSTVFALEQSSQALMYLHRNIRRNQSHVEVIMDDALKPMTNEKEFDLILCNPPYLSDLNIQHLQTEVTYEPLEALYAPQNGYLFYQQIPHIWKNHLQPLGYLLFEVGIGQAPNVKKILNSAGFINITTVDDLCGIQRVVLAQCPQS